MRKGINHEGHEDHEGALAFFFVIFVCFVVEAFCSWRTRRPTLLAVRLDIRRELAQPIIASIRLRAQGLNLPRFSTLERQHENQDLSPEPWQPVV